MLQSSPLRASPSNSLLIFVQLEIIFYIKEKRQNTGETGMNTIKRTALETLDD
jgi:hypothetical protein